MHSAYRLGTSTTTICARKGPLVAGVYANDTTISLGMPPKLHQSYKLECAEMLALHPPGTMIRVGGLLDWTRMSDGEWGT